MIEDISNQLLGHEGSKKDRDKLQTNIQVMLYQCSDDELKLFNYISKLSEDNNLFEDYEQDQGGYIPSDKKIHINLREMRYDRYLTDNGKQIYSRDMLALCHEAFHMLEYFATPNKNQQKQDHDTSFLSLTTDEGQAFYKAARQDMSDFLLKSTGYTLEHIMSSERSEVEIRSIQIKYSDYLKRNFKSELDRFNVSTMVDAIGMETKNLFSIRHLYNNKLLVDTDGFFTHREDYNHPKNCNSEIWANMGGARLRHAKSMINSQQDLFKQTTIIYNNYITAILSTIN